MIIHSEDNAKIEMKVTDEGDLFLFCPECHAVWQTSLNNVHKPKGVRPITYGGTGINLDMGSSEKAAPKKPAEGKAALAKKLFPDAFK